MHPEDAFDRITTMAIDESIVIVDALLGMDDDIQGHLNACITSFHKAVASSPTGLDGYYVGLVSTYVYQELLARQAIKEGEQIEEHHLDIAHLTRCLALETE